jgi:hypothetical protein
MPAHTVFDALHVAVSPVILISAYGLLLLSLTNRLGRAIDRARMLARESESNRAVQIAIIARRAKWIRSAILYVAIAIVSAAVLVLALFLSVFLPMDLKVLVTALFTLSLLCLIVSLGYFMVDIFGSLKAMEAELEDDKER